MQASLIATPCSAWERELYAPSTIAHSLGAEALPSGGILVFGHRYEVAATTGSDTAWTVVLDAEGHVTGASQVDLTTSTWAGSCATTSGEFVVHGLDYDPARHCTILRRRSDLSIRWWLDVAPPEDQPQGVIADARDGCFLSYRHPDPSGTDTYRIARLDPDGNVTWTIEQPTATRIAALADGGLVVGFPAAPLQPGLARLDASGNVTWQASGPTLTTSAYAAIVEDSDGTIVAVGDNGSGRPTWARWSADGRVLEAATWSIGTSADPFVISALRATPEGIVAAAVDKSSDVPVVLRLGAGLGMNSATSIEGGPAIQSVRLVRGLPNPAILCWVVPSGNNQRDWLLSLDSSFDPDAGCLRTRTRTTTPTPVTPTTNTATLSSVPAPSLSLTPFAAPEVPLHVEWRPHAGDAFEDDDAVATARPIDDGVPQQHDFCDDSDDWLRFESDRGVDYTVTATPIGTAASVHVDVLASDGTTVLTAADPGATTTSAAFRSTDRAFTYIRAGELDGTHGKNRDYELLLSGSTLPLMRWSRAFDEYDEVITIADSVRGPVLGSWWHEHRLDPSGVPLEKDAGERRVCPAADGGWYELGGTGTSMRVARMKPSGDLRWMRTIAGSSTIPYESLCEGSDGALWLAGGVGSSLCVARIDGDGTPSWATTFSAPNVTHRVALGPTRDGGALLAASFTGGPAVIRFAADGTQPWAQKLTGSLPMRWAAAIAETLDGGCILAATTANGLLNPDDALGEMSWAARLSPAGDVVWAKELSSGGYLHVIGGDAAPGGGLVACGDADLPSPRGGDGFLLQLQDDGSIAWARALDTGYYMERLWCARFARDGSLLAGGRAGNVEPGRDRWSAWALRLGPDGSMPTGCAGEVRDVAIDVTPYTLTNEPIVMSLGTPDIVTTPGSVARRMETASAWTRCIDGAVPGEVSPKTAATLLRFSTRTTFTWEDAAFSGSDTFEVFRGDVSALPTGDYGACLARGFTSPYYDDPAEPTNACWFYVVAGRNEYGRGVGTETSFGVRPTPSSSCP